MHQHAPSLMVPNFITTVVSSSLDQCPSSLQRKEKDPQLSTFTSACISTSWCKRKINILPTDMSLYFGFIPACHAGVRIDSNGISISWYVYIQNPVEKTLLYFIGINLNESDTFKGSDYFRNIKLSLQHCLSTYPGNCHCLWIYQRCTSKD